MRPIHYVSWALGLLAVLGGCGSSGSEADRVGIASQCTTTEDCPFYTLLDGGQSRLQCLTEFTGGYCGLTPCASSADCPLASICVAHTDANNYCFRVCSHKSDCNRNRSRDVEANCSSSFSWAVPAEDDRSKACIPPSSGT